MRRPRSPAVKPLNIQPHPSIPGPISPDLHQRTSGFSTPLTFLPMTFVVSFQFPWGRHTRKISGDFRKAGENVILLISLLYGVEKIWDHSAPSKNWIAYESLGLMFFSVLYLIWTHLSYFSLPKPLANKPQSSLLQHRYRSSSPHMNRKSASISSTDPMLKDDFGYIWMTVPKNYRDSTDDGVLTGLLLGPLISIACLYATMQQRCKHMAVDEILPSSWLIEAPITMHRPTALSALESLYRSRRALVQLSSMTSSLLLVHLVASRLYEGYHRARKTVPESERASVPRKEWLRTRLYAIFALLTATATLGMKHAFVKGNVGIWEDLSYLDVLAGSIFYQLTLYMAIRLAHHGFTLGELGFAAFGASIMFLETMHMTITKIDPFGTVYVKSFRLPDPLLIFQLALIPGSILVGVLLAPLLYLSRYIAQRPLHKLRFPKEKQVHLRFLALGFYLGAALITFGLIGFWTRWCLGGRNPWLWTLRWSLEGQKKWIRPSLLAYWGILSCISVAGWGRQLSRSRKYRQKASFASAPVINGETMPQMQGASVSYLGAASAVPVSSSTDQSSTAKGNATQTVNALGISLPALPALTSLPALPNATNVSVSTVATDLLDAADKRMPTLRLNARRKFFHALAVVMFVPGIAMDPAFMHLSFSVAFAIFTFAEFIRYFALYPFGAAIHVFLVEFVDEKDSGTAILSHFYLLTGCASSIWLEGPTKLLAYTGVLALGIGDAMASMIGKRFGRMRWSATSFKTVEGSAAFTLSIIASAWLLRLNGHVEPFYIVRYTTVVITTAMLEALSVQNDNLTLPWYMWSLQIILDVQGI